MSYEAMTRDELVEILARRDAVIHVLEKDAHDARNRLQVAWAQLEAIGASGVDRRLHTPAAAEVPQEAPSDAGPLPTLEMVVAGAEAVSLFRDTDAYSQMSGCEGSQESARVCWAAMVAEMPAGAVPRQDIGPNDAQLQGAWAEATFARSSEEAAVPFPRRVLERWGRAAPVAAQPEPASVAEPVAFINRGALDALRMHRERHNFPAGVMVLATSVSDNTIPLYTTPQPSAQPQAPAAQGDALAPGEAVEFGETLDQFEDCGETTTAYPTLLDWARRGLLECTHFVVTDAGNKALDAAMKENSNV